MQNPASSGQPPWTLLKLLRWATAYFEARDIEDARASAEILLAHSLGLARIDLYLRFDQPLGSDELQRVKPLIQRRVRREPVAYIVGEKEFWSLNFRVTPSVLIPRPETECLVEGALEWLPRDRPEAGLRVLELGTGSGAVIGALASERPGHRFFASDLSVDALCLARANLQRLGLGGAVQFFAGRWFDGCCPTAVFDLIVSNPPYIPREVIAGLQPEITRYEPRVCLDGGPDGLDAIRQIVHEALGHLLPGGGLLLEMGNDQRPAVEQIIEACPGYERVEFYKDYSGWDRGVRLRKKRS